MGCLDSKNQKEYQKVEFFCPECGELQPEISKINIDNKNIEFKCKICAEKEYNSHYFSKKPENNNIINYYCQPSKENQAKKIWFKIHQNEKVKLENNKNICQIISFSQKELNKAKEIIKKKNENLKKIIDFNKRIKEESQIYQNNYFYLKSLNNICTSYERENERCSNDIKFLFAALNYEIEISKKASKDFFDEKDIKIGRQETNLILNDKKLNDENIKCISLIKFNQLKEINLSGNDIKDIESLCYVNLPFLEFLNLSNNKIEKIEPLGDINSKELKYLFIQNNQIEDINVLLNPNIQTLDILRLEKNKINENSDSFKLLVKLYEPESKILIKNEAEIDLIQSTYNFKYNENVNNIEIENSEEGDKLLKKLFIIITFNNKIRKLKLKNNKIEDPSILNRIQFKYLEELDLSLNNIKNLYFLRGLKAKSLKKLYLENNSINDLSFLYTINNFFTELRFIYLKKNSFNPEDSGNKNLIDYLNSKKINLLIN